MWIALNIFASLAVSFQAKAALPMAPTDAQFLCARMTASRFPLPAEISKDDQIKLKDCGAAVAYYGLEDGRADFLKARRCALVEREQGWRVGSLSAGLLMAMYANGQGTARNYDLAERFVCETSLEPDEKRVWLGLLEKERVAINKQNLDYCDRIGRGPAELSCVLVRKQQQAVARAKKFKSLAANFSALEKTKLAKLLEVSARFFALDTSWRNASRLSGVARASFMNGHEAYAWDQLEMWIVKLERTQRITPGSELLVDVDDRLNKRYRELKASLAESDRPAFQKAQRTWIDYRDAFVDLAVSRYAPHRNSVWLAELTRRRLEEMAF